LIEGGKSIQPNGTFGDRNTLPVRTALSSRQFPDDDLGGLDDRGDFVSALESEIVDRLDRDGCGKRITRTNVDLHICSGLPADDSRDGAGNDVTCAELHDIPQGRVTVVKP
jgi:hypothetical protein